jgi:hypothetical protein
LSAVAPTAPPVSMEVMNTNFEEWMKLATDNVRRGILERDMISSCGIR